MTSSDSGAQEPTVDDLRAELAQVESELTQLHEESRSLRNDLKDSGPMDAADRSSILSQAEELESFAAELERRRETLRGRLGPS